jgi:hypothetical protein
VTEVTSDPLDEDADLRSNLAALGPVALRDLQDVLTWPQPRRDKSCARSSVGEILNRWRSWSRSRIRT